MDWTQLREEIKARQEQGIKTIKEALTSVEKQIKQIQSTHIDLFSRKQKQPSALRPPMSKPKAKQAPFLAELKKVTRRRQAKNKRDQLQADYAYAKDQLSHRPNIELIRVIPPAELKNGLIKPYKPISQLRHNHTLRAQFANLTKGNRYRVESFNIIEIPTADEPQR